MILHYLPNPRTGIDPRATEQRRSIRGATSWHQLIPAARAQWEWPIGSPEHSVLAAEVVVAKTKLMRGVNINESRYDGPITPGSFSVGRAWY